MHAEVAESQGGANPHFTNDAALSSPEAFHSTTFIPHQCFLRRWLRTRLQRCLRSLCSLSVLVSMMYFVFLASVTVIITTTTSIKTSQVLESTWEDAHSLQMENVESSIAAVADIMVRRTVAAASLYAQTLHPVESNRTLAMLCAQLAIGDTSFRIRGLALGAFSVTQYALCTHADETNPSPENMTAILSDKGTFKGSFFINPATYTSYDPPKFKAAMNQSMTGAQQIEAFKHLIPTLGMLDAYMNGTRGPLSPVELWTSTVNQTNKMYFTFPLYMLGDSVPSSPLVHPSDFAQTRIDADTLLNISDLTNNDVSIRAMVLGRSSLTTGDPIVLSNNWKQPGVSQSAYFIIINSSTTYLTVSTISDPLMREAVKHVDLENLLDETYHYTTTFNYHGAPALVTAWVYVNDVGFSLPIVLVTPQHTVAGPIVTIWRICTGAVAVTVFLTTLLFYFAVDRYLSRPLREVTAAMEASVERGVRQPVRGAACDVVQLAETRELACAYNAAMAQLRVVDAFVPDAVRATRRGGPSLREHYLTVVTVRVRAGSGAGGAGGAAYDGDVGVDTSALLRRHPGAGTSAGAGAGGVSGDRGRRGGGGLAALVNAVAEAATALTNSGPFASAASLSAFVAAVRELCEARGGTVHRAAPDECVLHFAANVRRVLSGSGAGSGGGAGAGAATGDCSLAAALERAADADARAGVECALCVSRWVEQYQHQQQQQRGNSNGDSDSGGCVEAVPDVRVVVDSGVFVCGEYRAPGSEQTLCVALGRDVAGAVGHVPAAIGVRVAATGEAALRVRGGAGGSAGGGTAAAAAACSPPPPFPPAAAERGGFRVLPVEALRTGRAGLDGGAVTLYEVLPGAVDGDAAWLAYARCCDDGFECMVRGDYAGALRAYRGVGEICDLEPGLLPRCLSREAAHSNAVGGAVSVQVARLMRECERRVRAGSTAGYERRRHVPFGIDAVLGEQVPGSVGCRTCDSVICSTGGRSLWRVLEFPRSVMTLSTGCGSPRSGGSGKGSTFIHRWGAGYGSECRYLITVQTFCGPVRRCVGSLPAVIRDNKGLKWLLPRTKDHECAAVEWMRPYPVLGSAGTLCSVMTVLFREGGGLFRKKLDGVPDGPMSDELRSAIPVWTLSDGAVRGFDRLIAGYSRRVHPNIVQLVSYSLEVEGRAVIMWEYCPGGTMRDVVRRYSYLSRVTLLRFSTGLLSALVYTHACGAAHGFVSQDTAVVGTDGVCRLMGGYADYALGVKLVLVWNTCYVSPLMATGAAPTPACDMFLYGLMALEVLTRGPAWMWAAVPDGTAPHGTAAELAALMAAGAKPFCDAVVDGRVVPNCAALNCVAQREFYGDEWCDSILRLLTYKPEERPTAAQMLAETKEIMSSLGRSA